MRKAGVGPGSSHPPTTGAERWLQPRPLLPLPLLRLGVAQVSILGIPGPAHEAAAARSSTQHTVGAQGTPPT